MYTQNAPTNACLSLSNHIFFLCCLVTTCLIPVHFTSLAFHYQMQPGAIGSDSLICNRDRAWNISSKVIKLVNYINIRFGLLPYAQLLLYSHLIQDTEETVGQLSAIVHSCHLPSLSYAWNLLKLSFINSLENREIWSSEIHLHSVGTWSGYWSALSVIKGDLVWY